MQKKAAEVRGGCRITVGVMLATAVQCYCLAV
jgi:hypothetical protein